jgi:hypothetical protein
MHCLHLQDDLSRWAYGWVTKEGTHYGNEKIEKTKTGDGEKTRKSRKLQEKEKRTTAG